MVRQVGVARIIAAACGIALLIPSLVLAQDGAVLPTPIHSNFCASVDEIGERFVGRMSSHQTEYDRKRIEIRTKLSARLNERMARVAVARQATDVKRLDAEGTLLAKASSEAQKAAVDEYIAALNDAMRARRSAADAAVASYRAALDAEIQAREGLVKSALDIFLTDGDFAISQAKADCASGTAKPLDIRINYIAHMNSARSKMVNSIKSIESRKDALLLLINARKADIAEAVTSFTSATPKTHKKLLNTLQK